MIGRHGYKKSLVGGVRGDIPSTDHMTEYRPSAMLFGSNISDRGQAGAGSDLAVAHMTMPN